MNMQPSAHNGLGYLPSCSSILYQCPKILASTRYLAANLIAKNSFLKLDPLSPVHGLVPYTRRMDALHTGNHERARLDDVLCNYILHRDLLFAE